MTINWNQMPPGIVFGLKHSINQVSMTFRINGRDWDPVVAWKFRNHPEGYTAQYGGDIVDRARGPVHTDPIPKGFCWFETHDPNFPFPRGDLYAWAYGFPPSLVFGLKHSTNQPQKKFKWMTGGDEFEMRFVNFDPAVPGSGAPYGFLPQNGGDLNGGAGEGFYWYETQGGHFSDWNTRLRSGLVFGLKHSRNQATKKFKWGGNYWDPVVAYKNYYSHDRRRYIPEGFIPRHGGDLGGSAGEGFYWFESR